MDHLTEMLPLLIPIVAIVGGLSIPILYIVTQFKKRQQLLEQNHKERMLALEKGMELPPIPVELLTNDPFAKAMTDNTVESMAVAGRTRCYSPERQLRTGLFWLIVGAALGVALWVEPHGHPVWALLPIAVGVAKLVFYALAPKVGGKQG